MRSVANLCTPCLPVGSGRCNVAAEARRRDRYRRVRPLQIFYGRAVAPVASMRCLYCHHPAGLLRRTCRDCAKVVGIIETAAGQVGPAALVDLLASEGFTRDQVDAVLDARIDDRPTLRDRMTSQMANALMRGLGMPGRQSPEDVRRIRTTMESGGGEGTWRSGETPPEDH